MKAAAWLIEGFCAFAKRGWRASCEAAIFRALLNIIKPRGKRVLSNLELVYPEKDSRWRKCTRRHVYDNLGWMLAEILTLQRDPAQALDWVEETIGARYIEGAIEAGGGVIFLSAHYGNWELAAAWYAQYLKKKGLHNFYIVSQNTRDPDIADIIERFRTSAGIKLLPKSTPTLEFVKLLKSGANVAALADISWLGGVVLPFMGQPCRHTMGPAVLASLSGSPIIPVALYRKAPFRHAVEFFQPITARHDPKEKNRRLEIENTAREIISATERIITPRPELWFWLHNRWKHPL
ncbi:lipid A biosynthesis acyltransferase [Synergistales bacterium]|nr:lipid A biosynthesis acyltransferase [Synergistales bacterium]